MISFLYIILAILGLSFLIFIHELGHYFMARRVGMRVETFAIGFGKPIFSWVRNGVKWQIGWLPFGGYVKIAGSELSDDKNPYDIPDGFFGKSATDRIKVALAGPVVNLLFAFIVFFFLWFSGGREKNFSEYTKKIGWVDPQSELFSSGIRSGDEVVAYNGNPFQSSKDHLYAPITGSEVTVKGNKVDYSTGTKVPFEYTVKSYPHPNSLEKGIMTTGIFQSANYIIYDRLANGEENPLPEGSPLQNSGIQYGDRIFWVNGELVFSAQQLNQLLSGEQVLLTIQRGDEQLLARVPRIHVKELKPDSHFREELIDWQFAANLQNSKIQNLFYIPYNLTDRAVVENQLKFIDKENETQAFPENPYSNLEKPLQAGDKILAINGTPISYSYELLEALQTYKVNLIVERNENLKHTISSSKEDEDFDQQVNWNDLEEIANSIGTDHPISEKGNYVLLKPVAPKVRSEFAVSLDKQAWLATEMQAQKKEIESIEDPEKRTHALRLLENQEKRLLLGLPGIQDRRVDYNPSPTELFGNVFQEISRTLLALVSGSLNPKWISGPIGIVQVVHQTSMTSLKEALYWLGAISLNLGILNLLPIPVLDGGTILISLFEVVTRKRIHPKTLEKMIIPFALLLVAFFIYLTYNDLSRLFAGIFY